MIVQRFVFTKNFMAARNTACVSKKRLLSCRNIPFAFKNARKECVDFREELSVEP